jgi:hypothetical protein
LFAIRDSRRRGGTISTEFNFRQGRAFPFPRT